VKENQIHDIERKAVQMNSLARNFAMNLELEKLQEFGDIRLHERVLWQTK